MDCKAARRILIGSESHAHAARPKNGPSLAIEVWMLRSFAPATRRDVPTAASAERRQIEVQTIPATPETALAGASSALHK